VISLPKTCGISGPRGRFTRHWPASVLLCASLPGCDLLNQEGQQSAAQQAATPLEVVAIEVQARDTPIAMEFVGKTASSRRVEIRSRVDGFLEKRLYQEGSMVDVGQVLFQMDRKPFEAQVQAAQAELAQQQARLENATANLRRVEPLVKQKAVAQKELDDALGMYRSAAAAVEGAKANVVQSELNLGYTTIKSPVTGLSSFAVKREGAYIGIGDSLLTYVAQLEPMWVEFSISENQLLRAHDQEEKGLIRLPADGDFDVEVILADGSVYPHTGRITFADASLSEATGTFLLRAEVANPQHTLRPGQFVRVRLKGALRPGAILVPQRAVQQGAKGSFVWVVDGDAKAEFRPITVGPWYEDQWFVNEGLKAGERVVVEGALKLRAGVPVTVTPPSAPDSERQPAAGS